MFCRVLWQSNVSLRSTYGPFARGARSRHRGHAPAARDHIAGFKIPEMGKLTAPLQLSSKHQGGRGAKNR